jgi:hypothetical protein
MKTYGWLLGCSVCVGLSGAASTQGAVSFADLQGAVIQTRVLFQREGLSNGRPFQNQGEVVNTITITSANSLTTSAVSTADTPRGTRTSPTRSGSFTLGQPREIQAAGGGHALWIFEDGQLINLRTFRAGAYKGTISFSRGADGLRCTIRAAYAREAGIADWNWISPITGTDIQMKSIKPISSSCQVSKR